MGHADSFQSKVKMDSEEDVDEGSDNMVMDAMFGESESKNQIGSTHSCTQNVTNHKCILRILLFLS